jgi:ubiquinone/menaquinone biosynthesis C-methylase UbiE
MIQERLKKMFNRIYAWLPEPTYTRVRNEKLFDWMNQNGPGKRVLNLGSGVGQFDHYLSKNIKTINLDISFSKKNLHVVADAHFLPFKSECLDVVYSIAVLEHVKKPWIVADEIFRVLHSGGYVVLELPFLNVIHDEHDYFRFTDKGIRSLFDERRFDVILEQVGSGGGSFLSVFLLEYFEQFVPTKYLKALWRISIRYVFCLLKYLDYLIDNSKKLRMTANSFSFVGRRR